MADWNGFKKNGTTYIPNDATARASISTIEGKIPSAASSSNKLVDTSTMTTELNGKVNVSSVGANNGVAGLDANGRVPSSQLPSYVDDVLEYDSQSDFPATGETGKIYIALDTNKTFRWSGSAYVEISESLALGETSSTAYAGNKGKANADAISAMKDGSSIDSFGDVETALAGKVDKVTGKGLSTNDYDNTAKGIVDNIQSNVIANTKLIKDTVGWSGKNLITTPFQDGTITKAGITFTLNSDLSITANGTATSDAWFVMHPNTQANYIEDGEYIASGCPNGGGAGKYEFQTRFMKTAGTGGSNDLLIQNYGGENKFTLENTSSFVAIFFGICIRSGNTVNNIVFKPMIRPADILDPTYEPYFDSTAFPRSEQAVLGAKNVIKNNLASSSTANVEVVVNSDKSVSMSNTANADVWLTVYSGLNFLSKGHWHLNGCPSNGGAEKYFLCFIVRNADNTANETTYYDYGDGVDFDITDTNINRSIRIYIYVKSGQATNFTYYPMISLDGGSYVAPAMTNKELTEKHEIKDVTFTAGTGIDVRPATFVKIEDKLLVGYFALKNDTENAMPINTVLATISGVPIHHGANWVLPAVITDNMSNTAVMITHDMTSNTLIFKNQSSLPAGNTITFSLTEYMIKA